MTRGPKNSPFVGQEVVVNNDCPLLYRREFQVSTPASKVSGPVEAHDESQRPKKRKKKASAPEESHGTSEPCRPRTKSAEEPVVEAASQKKKRKPRSEKGELRRKLRAEKRASVAEEVEGQPLVEKQPEPERFVQGASTLRDEALVLREHLGLLEPPPAAAADDDADAAADGAEDGGTENGGSAAAGAFKFGFDINPQVEAEMDARAARLSGMVRTEEGRLVRGAAPEEGRRLYIGGMPFSYDEDAIREYWEYCGEVEDVDMMTFPDTGNFRGIAFVTFRTKEGAQAALEYDGTDCDGKTLKIKVAHGGPKKARASGKQGEPQKAPGYNVVYVGNLPFDAAEDDIRAHFAGCSISKVRIHTDKATGASRGYAHVHFEDDASVDAAVGLNQSSLQGRQLKVMYAQPKAV
uniref:Nucleolin n=1 Tax=Tetraselmis sp. GSL018 TaxID=582737 RepID=A0A061R067_9CHLO